MAINLTSTASKENPTIARVQNNFKNAAKLLGMDEADLISELESSDSENRVSISANGKTIRFTKNTAGMWLALAPDLVRAGRSYQETFLVPKQAKAKKPIHSPSAAINTEDNPQTYNIGDEIAYIPKGETIPVDKQILIEDNAPVTVVGTALVESDWYSHCVKSGEARASATRVTIDNAEYYLSDGSIRVTKA